MHIGSMILSAISKLHESPLSTSLDRLTPLHNIVPNWKVEEHGRPGFLLRKSHAPLEIDWRTITSNYPAHLMPGKEESDNVMISEMVECMMQRVYKKLDVAIAQFEGSKFIMLPWVDPIFRVGWGDYDTYNGGFGAFTDPRTGLTFQLRIFSPQTDGNRLRDITISLLFSMIRYSEEDIPYEMGEVGDYF